MSKHKKLEISNKKVLEMDQLIVISDIDICGNNLLSLLMSVNFFNYFNPQIYHTSLTVQ